MVERIRTLLETRQLTPTQFADIIGVARPIVSHVLSGRNKPSLEVVQRILGAMPDLSIAWLLNGTGPMLASAAPLAANPTPQPAIQASAAAAPVIKEPIVSSPAPALSVVQPTSLGRPPQPVSAPRPAPAVAAAAKPSQPPLKRFTASAVKPTPVAAAVAQPKPFMRSGAGSVTPLVATSEPASELAAETEPEAASVPTPPATTVAPESMASPEAPSVAPLSAALFAGAEKPIRRIVIFYRDGSFADYQPE